MAISLSVCTQTTGLALMLSFSTIGFFSMYFDVKEWQTQYGEWQQSLSMAHSAHSVNPNLMADLSAKRTSVGTSTISPNNALIEEEGNAEGELEANIVNMDELESGVQIINQQMESEQKKRAQNMGNTAERTAKPVLTYQSIGHHMYEPTKLFFMCNAPIWLFCGSVTGMIAARILTNGIVINPMNIVAGFGAMCLAERSSDHPLLDLMECDGESEDH